MTIRTKLIACLAALGLIIATLAMASFLTLKSSDAALETLLVDFR